ncbi:DsbA family oxidoreductase [Oceaniserpentilla sp. 4NH20-0058]|uniref:DsbA family oxidoreductase n=1 Tax=Oceaniserpentilla sp. 4NH20-0058 TaxID=3127660 RepID=UPI0031045478
MKTLQIDIVSDVVCPWCAIGYGNLNTALSQVKSDLQAKINWHPFQLNSHMPKQGQDIGEHLVEKYGLTNEQRKVNQERIKLAGEAAGVTFNFGERSRIYNTFDCHVLLTLAAQMNKQTELKLALFNGYFTQGLDISDSSVLINICEEVGIQREQAEQALSDSILIEQVKKEEEQFKSMGIQSVPAFIVNQKYLISGGQPVESFKQALLEIANKE